VAAGRRYPFLRGLDDVQQATACETALLSDGGVDKFTRCRARNEHRQAVETANPVAASGDRFDPQLRHGCLTQGVAAGGVAPTVAIVTRGVTRHARLDAGP
jgi:hypothetical protein